ncbi:glyoxylase I family protein [Breznakia sp. PF5-3]|uniref:VOC family protein n=1 Tax=unclassified Breznakia TaxID=2623764 RepID=UPI002405A905|nr:MULTISPECIES: VOC family protein [unclassified Breznakia]MDF9825798.1 glyoxylase I family protein [Breznakia sp. PM6-1]MDF9836603.1 glyoxylase I family protein [Breznakia sp. PF5-3]MDF9838847.1 glyoxylase I family protein [Breznakia sp. PFB2-8]MDF9860873.1 glyoxylase I family protein [Breznakia sp. PH5-24]
MISEFVCVNVMSKDPKALVKFYHEILGIPILFAGFGNNDGTNLGFIKKAPTICIWNEHTWGKSDGYATLVFCCDDLQTTYKEIIAKGYPIEPPVDKSWGGRELNFDDPDGNHIIILE